MDPAPSGYRLAMNPYPYRTGAGRPDRRDDLAAELRASFAFVIGTMAVLLLASVVGLALS